MKALFKLFAIVTMTLIMTGCGHMGTILGATAGASIGGTKGAFVGGVLGAAVDNDAVMRGTSRGGERGSVGRCDPPPSDALVAWATELDNPQQKRVARATSTNGRVQCYASETGSSQMGGRPNSVAPQAGGNPSVYRWVPSTNSRSPSQAPSQIIDMQ